ncbi:MAG: hypothetical protein H6R18_1259 [Proteobacteria bacterium]|nr:hypothetical protein [Pseudomonadota bacterium]
MKTPLGIVERPAYVPLVTWRDWLANLVSNPVITFVFGFAVGVISGTAL